MAKQKRGRDEILRDRKVSETFNKIVDEVTHIFENQGFIPGDNPKNPKATPVKLLQLYDAVSEIAEYIAYDAGVWDAKSGRDAIGISDIPELIQTSIVRTVQRAAEPRLVLANLLTHVTLEPGEFWSEQYMGGISGIADWSSPGGELPPVPPIQTASTVGAGTRRYGLLLNFSDEVVQANSWNIVQLHLEEAAKDMARFKERETYRMIASNSTYRIAGSGVGVTAGVSSVVHNGIKIYAGSGAAAASGRDPISLAYNYTVTLDDIFDMMAEVMTLNEAPDTLIFSPFAWSIFARNGEMREWAFINGRSPFIKAPSGDLGSLSRLEGNGRNLPGQPALSNQATTFIDVPHFPHPLNIIVTPTAFYSPSSAYCDIIMGVSGKFGVSLDSPAGVTTVKWDDPIHAFRSIALEEKWNVQPLAQGQYIISAVEIALKPSARVQAAIAYADDPEA